MINFKVGVYIGLIAFYLSFSLGIASKLRTKNVPFISSIIIAPIIPIVVIISNIIIAITNIDSNVINILGFIIPLTFKKFNYFIGTICNLIAINKFSFIHIVLLPISMYKCCTENTNKINKSSDRDIEKCELYTEEIRMVLNQTPCC